MHTKSSTNFLFFFTVRFSLGLMVLMLASGIGEPPKAQADSFLPTWKLMNDDEKQQFIAGYLQGWRDAASVTDIAISFVKNNPASAVESLEKVKELYDIREIRPSDVTQEIDLFYSDPTNSNAPLSKAITAARARVRY
jgi:hypothetical protein